MADPKDQKSTGPTEPAEGADLSTEEMKPVDDKGNGDGVPRTYASETKEGKEVTSFGGPQGGD